MNKKAEFGEQKGDKLNMKNPIKPNLENEESNEPRNIKAWEQQRAKGKWHFVLKIGLLWSLLTIAGFTLFEYLLDGRIRIEILPFKILMFVALGFVLGLILWGIGEKKYQKYLEENS